MKLYNKRRVSGSKGREKKKKEEKGGAEGQSAVVLYKMGHGKIRKI